VGAFSRASATVKAAKIRGVGRRSYGTGSLLVRVDSRGRESWYGQWRVDGRLTKRKLGPKRTDSADGLTKSAAERELRRLIEQAEREPRLEAVDMAEAARRWLSHLALMGRKRSTLMDYESAVRIHLVPFFGDREVDVPARVAHAPLAALGEAHQGVQHAQPVAHALR
jgi:hypothetical protein